MKTRMFKFFKSPPKQEPTPEPTCEQIRADRIVELRRDLDRLNSEAETISASLLEFLFSHRTPNGDFFGSSLEELPELRQQEFQLRKRESEIMVERSRVLEELSKLVKNDNESVHVEGRLIRA
jgi:hypothetical protein